jgi:hypothetical protein
MNILDAYKDAENMMIENYEAIGFRNLSLLKKMVFNKRKRFRTKV